MTGANKRKSNPEYERQQFINFFEELSWLLESNKDLNFKKASQFLREYRNWAVHGAIVSGTSNNAYNLIGVLPIRRRSTGIEHPSLGKEIKERNNWLDSL